MRSIGDALLARAACRARRLAHTGAAWGAPALVALALLVLPAAADATAAPGPARGYLALAEQGLDQQSGHWRTSAHHWYCETLRCRGDYPLLTVWGVVRMFETADAVALAAPSGAHRRAVQWYAQQSQSLYWNRYLRGFDPYPGDDYPAAEAWFDDNGWLGLAFVDAYRATGQRRWLTSAQRAFDFIAAHGWAPEGGMWWNIQHDHLSGEALAAASLLGMMLHQATGNRADLARARQWIDWANSHDLGVRGLYASEGPHSTTIDYVQSPLIYAQYLLCRATGVQSYCAHAAELSDTLAHVYGVRYVLAPLYDSIYFQWMMAYDRATGNTHWIGVAQANADAAARNATDGSGLWLASWWGGRITDPNTTPGMFRTMAGTASLYAWLAYYTSPSS